MVSSETIYLSVDKEKAADIIDTRVPHLRQGSSDESITFYTNVGLHLATISEVPRSSGANGSKLRYRSAIIRPHLLHAHNKARDIREAVDEFRIPDGHQ